MPDVGADAVRLDVAAERAGVAHTERDVLATAASIPKPTVARPESFSPVSLAVPASPIVILASGFVVTHKLHVADIALHLHGDRACRKGHRTAAHRY